MKRKFIAILVGLLLTSSMAVTLTACGNDTDTSSSIAQTRNSVSNDTSSSRTIPEKTAISDITITIPEEFEMDVDTAQENVTYFTLKNNSSATGTNNGSNGTANNNNGSNGVTTGNNGSTGTANNSNGSNGTTNDNNGSNENTNGNGNSSTTDNSNSSSNNNENIANNVTIRVINVAATPKDFQSDIDNPSTPESVKHYLETSVKYPNVTVDNFKREQTDDQIRYEYQYSYTYNNQTYPILEFTCLTNNKFVSIVVTPKSAAYLEQAQQAFRQVVDSFQP